MNSSRGIPWVFLLVIATAQYFISFADASYPVGPNRFLGTCLDNAWVKQMEAARGISSQERDSSGRLVYPFLQPALRFSRYKVKDPRTASRLAFADSCMPAGQQYFGADQDAQGTTKGDIDGTLIMDLCGWDTHALATIVLAIVAEEVSGYKVSFISGVGGAGTTQRMSSVGMGVCTPSHVNVEVWTSSTMSTLRMYMNESYIAGGVGYFGLSGLYTTHQFVLDGGNATPPYFPDFWKHYKISDPLIDSLSAAKFKANSTYYPPATKYCPDGTLGCLDDCERTWACTLREAAGKNCLMVAMMIPGYDQGYFQAVLDNIDIPAYFCFIGYGGLEKYASDAVASGSPVLFYHYEPDLFHVTHKGQFDRVFLPRTDPDRVKLSTGTYGENGYGKKTSNPLNVDYPSLQLTKFAASLVKDLPIGSLFAKLTLTDSDINDLLGRYGNISGDAAVPEPYFRAACDWVQANYDTWSEWLDRLPLCTFDENIVSNVTGCNSTYRQISFAWKEPNPGDASLPNTCDGGIATLPGAINTSRSCDWINDNPHIWADWITEKPPCDSTFYDYSVSDCASDAYRTVTYHWNLANATDPRFSAECESGENLPATLKIDCEYMPTSSPSFAALAAFAAIAAVVLVAAAILVYKHRDAPIIRRSQYEMLLLMIFGGFFTTGASVAYAGRPTEALCGVRPVLVTLGFTTIFGALVIKSLRVYRVFMKAAMKRVKITILQILKILAIFYVGDIVIFVAWFAADFPKPTVTSEEASEFRGTVDRISCNSSSFIFTALLIFWKMILLMIGLYLSFLIRNVSVDFQESPWIFGSVCVVLVGSLVMMPMSYLVKMPAPTYYIFLACVLLICTMLIMGLMLVPKIFRLKEVGSVSQSSMASVRSRNSQPPGSTRIITNATETDVEISSQKYQVKPTNNNYTTNSSDTTQ